MSLRWPPSSTSLTFLGLVGLFGTQVAWVAPTNFYGFDEWTLHYLVSRGITDIPYANRPLELLWQLPAHWLSPQSFAPYLVLYTAYSLLSSWCVFRLCRRLVPESPALAVLAACFVLVYAPRDAARLSHFERTLYTSFVFGALAAFVCFVESWLRRSVVLLALSILVAFVTARSYEATIALLLAWPLFVAWALRERSRAYWIWAAAWEGFVTLALTLIVQPLIFPLVSRSYQDALGMDLHPGRIAARVLREYAYHLVPLVTTPWRELEATAVPVSVAIFGLTALAGVRGVGGPLDGGGRRLLLPSMAAGLMLAGLGYVVLCVSRQAGAVQAWRMQFLSGPGISLFLAAVVHAIAALVPRSFRRAAMIGLGCWVVVVGTARTLAMQKEWDVASFHRNQVRMLTGLTSLVPDLKPHTLVIVLDDGGAWRSTWAFRHAVQYLYPDRAIGHVWASWEFMFPTRWTRSGVACVPWPEVQLAWRSPPTLHRYEELILVRHDSAGDVDLLEDWPPALPPLPPGARYDPRSRIVKGSPLPEERSLLRSLAAWSR